MFSIRLDRLAHSLHRRTVNVLARRPGCHTAARRLQEAAIAAPNFRHTKACHLQKRVGGVDDGLIGESQVADDQGDGAVDGAEIDLWVWPCVDAEEDGHNVQTGRTVEAGIDERVGIHLVLLVLKSFRDILLGLLFVIEAVLILKISMGDKPHRLV